jgi:preprotein translocase subunit SecE
MPSAVQSQASEKSFRQFIRAVRVSSARIFWAKRMASFISCFVVSNLSSLALHKGQRYTEISYGHSRS